MLGWSRMQQKIHTDSFSNNNPLPHKFVAFNMYSGGPMVFMMDSKVIWLYIQTVNDKYFAPLRAVAHMVIICFMRQYSC